MPDWPSQAVEPRPQPVLSGPAARAAVETKATPKPSRGDARRMAVPFPKSPLVAAEFRALPSLVKSMRRQAARPVPLRSCGLGQALAHRGDQSVHALLTDDRPDLGSLGHDHADALGDDVDDRQSSVDV